jgi:hypothetical protein
MQESKRFARLIMFAFALMLAACSANGGAKGSASEIELGASGAAPVGSGNSSSSGRAGSVNANYH